MCTSETQLPPKEGEYGKGLEFVGALRPACRRPWCVCCSDLQCVAVYFMYPPVRCDSKFLDRPVVSFVGRDYRVRESVEPYTSDDILQKRPIILKSLLPVATP